MEKKEKKEGGGGIGTYRKQQISVFFCCYNLWAIANIKVEK